MNEEYIKRINKIMGYIDTHLSADLSLATLSKLACYSPFHLHRLFKSRTTETLNEYVTRKRIEKAASLLIHRKEIPVSELVLQLGFGSNSSFTRAFKKQYGQSPSHFRQSNPLLFSKIGKLESKNRQEQLLPEAYICSSTNLKKQLKMNATIEIKEWPKMDLAFITQIGTDGLDAAFARLLRWAIPKELAGPNLKLLRIYHDSFKITEPNKVRMSACILLTKKVEPSGEIGLTSIEQGKCIVARLEIAPQDFKESWQGLFLWMNENGYQKADRNPFEILYTNYNEHPEKKVLVDLCIPIE
jgi:AraC family transcriptional regulator